MPVEMTIEAPELVGREEEYAKLKQVLGKAIEGKGSTIFISGEAGIGKTRIMSELMQEAEDKGVLILSGRCLAEGTTPYLPFIEITEGLLKPEGDKQKISKRLKKGIEAAVPGIIGFIPVVGIPVGIAVSFVIATAKKKKLEPEDLEKLRDRMLNDYLNLVKLWSEEQPVLLVIDDLQWSDPSSLALIHYLSRNTKNNRVLIVGLYRPEDIVEAEDGKAHQLETAMQNMSREGLFETMGLERLDPNKTQKIIESSLGKASLDSAFYSKVFEESDGNPFFIIEVIRLLAEEGLVVQDKNGTWNLTADIDSIDIPSKVYDVIKRRLNRLMKEQKKILECASVVGEEFISDIVVNVTGQKKMLLLENLSEIEKTHQLIHYLQDKYRFDHAKVKEVLYNGIGEELRREYHKLVGDTIAEIYKDNEEEVVNELAYHYYKARDNRASEFLAKAGNLARDRYANEEAILLYRQALEIIMDDEEKTEILSSLGYVYFYIGDYNRALENCEKALEIHQQLGDKSNVASVLGRIGGLSNSMRNYDGALEYYEKALEIHQQLGDKSNVAKTLIKIGWVYSCHENYDKALENLEKALEIHQQLGDKSGVAKTLINIGWVYQKHEDYDRALENYGKVLEIQQQLGDKSGVASVLINIGWVYQKHEDYGRALEKLEIALEIHQQLGDKMDVAETLFNIGWVYYDCEDYGRTLENFEKALEIHQQLGVKSGVAMVLIGIGWVYCDCEDYDRALENFEKALEISMQLEYKSGEERALGFIGFIYHERGDCDKALIYYKRARCLREEMKLDTTRLDKWIGAIEQIE